MTQIIEALKAKTRKQLIAFDERRMQKVVRWEERTGFKARKNHHLYEIDGEVYVLNEILKRLPLFETACIRERLMRGLRTWEKLSMPVRQARIAGGKKGFKKARDNWKRIRALKQLQLDKKEHARRMAAQHKLGSE